MTNRWLKSHQQVECNSYLSDFGFQLLRTSIRGSGNGSFLGIELAVRVTTAGWITLIAQLKKFNLFPNDARFRFKIITITLYTWNPNEVVRPQYVMNRNHKNLESTQEKCLQEYSVYKMCSHFFKPNSISSNEAKDIGNLCTKNLW